MQTDTKQTREALNREIKEYMAIEATLQARANLAYRRECSHRQAAERAATAGDEQLQQLHVTIADAEEERRFACLASHDAYRELELHLQRELTWLTLSA